MREKILQLFVINIVEAYKMNEFDIFYKTPKKIMSEAKDTLKGTYKKCIKANLLGLAILLGVAVLFVLALMLLKDFLWLQATLCTIIAVGFVFIMGTVIVGNAMFYTALFKEDAKVKDCLSSFNNVWKYGQMFLYKTLICCLFFIISLAIVFLIFINIYSGIWADFLSGEIETFGEVLNTVLALDSFKTIIVLLSVFSALSSLWYIFKSIKHSVLFVSVADFPKQTLRGAYKTSSKAIKGNKIRFVKLWFNLLPHMLFCGLTGGIYLIWFWPYYQTCKVVFYNDLIAEF